MKYGELIIEKKEYEFLKDMMSRSKYHKDNTNKASIHKLGEELKVAKIVSRTKMPEDVIRLNSFVTIKTPYAEEKTYQIVIPEKGDISKNKISILAPMSLALFGYAEKDKIMWQFPRGESAIEITGVKQEEKVLSK